LSQPNAIDESSHIFFYFGSQKFIESSSSKFVNKLLYELSILWHSESEMDIDINVSVILGWASLNWSVIVNNIFGEHASNSDAPIQRCPTKDNAYVDIDIHFTFRMPQDA
jgi:hypothetical protein